jgi:hypothetical protein
LVCNDAAGIFIVAIQLSNFGPYRYLRALGVAAKASLAAGKTPFKKVVALRDKTIVVLFSKEFCVFAFVVENIGIGRPLSVT